MSAESALRDGNTADFQLIETMWGHNTVILYYVNHKATRSCDFFEFNAVGKVARNLVHYTG